MFHKLFLSRIFRRKQIVLSVTCSYSFIFFSRNFFFVLITIHARKRAKFLTRSIRGILSTRHRPFENVTKGKETGLGLRGRWRVYYMNM